MLPFHRFLHIRHNFTSVASEPVNKIYLEKVTGFSATSQRKLNALGKFSSTHNQVSFLPLSVIYTYLSYFGTQQRIRIRDNS